MADARGLWLGWVQSGWGPWRIQSIWYDWCQHTMGAAIGRCQKLELPRHWNGRGV